jgi:hypothetical protein
LLLLVQAVVEITGGQAAVAVVAVLLGPTVFQLRLAPVIQF